jgi:hypothetical protein
MTDELLEEGFDESIMQRSHNEGRLIRDYERG